MKKIVWVFLIIAIGLVGFWYVQTYVLTNTETKTVATDVTDVTFTVEGREFPLNDGKAALPITPDSATMETLTMFGEPVRADLDGDGDQDAAVLLVHEGGGSGVFYYTALALFDGVEYRATNAVYLGDRIAPQNIDVQEGKVVVNFADRKEGESMTEEPSEGKSVWIQLDAERQQIREFMPTGTTPLSFTETYGARIDRVDVTFEHKDYTSYRLTTNGLVREGELNTERGFEVDPDATVYVLNWQQPESEQMYFVRLTDEPTKLFMLDSARKLLLGSVLTKVE